MGHIQKDRRTHKTPSPQTLSPDFGRFRDFLQITYRAVIRFIKSGKQTVYDSHRDRP